MGIKTIHQKEAIKFAWDTVLKNFLFFLGLALTIGIIEGTTNGIFAGLRKGEAGWIIIFLFYLIMLYIGIMFGLGRIKISLDFVRQQKAKFSDLFSCRQPLIILKQFAAVLLFILIEVLLNPL